MNTITRITSTDQTTIATWTSGDGPPLVLVHGTTSDHTTWRLVHELLEPHLTIHAIDRRGRCGSGDGPAYAIEREFEDVAAVVRAVAETTARPVDLLGHSYGGLCALGAATLAGDALRRLVLYEPAYRWVPEPTPGVLDRLTGLLAAGRRADLLEQVLRVEAGLTEAEFALVRAAPSWPSRVAAAHTVPRELAAEAAFDPEPDWLKPVTAPTLLLLGGASAPGYRASAELIRGELTDTRVAVMPGQGHVAQITAPRLLVDLVVAFLASADRLA
jgi:pimeloyl-ACP methyl ester carboxylesterase